MSTTIGEFTEEATPTATSTGGPAAHTVIVGKGDVSFEPDTLKAEIGDTIHFEFFPANHSLIRGTYEHPCLPYDMMTAPNDYDSQGDIWSRFQPVSTVRDSWRMPWYNMTLQIADPIYLYCGAPKACDESAMVMIINPVKGKSIASYKAAALKAKFQLVPGEPFPTNEGTGVPTPTFTPTPSHAATNTAPAATTIIATPPAQKSGISTGAIAGIAIGGVATLAIIGILFFLLFTRGRRQKIVALPPSQQQFGGASPAYNNNQQQQQPQTIIIPMTEAEKTMYLERLSNNYRNGMASPVNGDLRPDSMAYTGGTVNSTMTAVSRNTSDRSSRPPWQEYGSPQSPAEMPPAGYDYQRGPDGSEWINHPQAPHSPPPAQNHAPSHTQSPPPVHQQYGPPGSQQA